MPISMPLKSSAISNVLINSRDPFNSSSSGKTASKSLSSKDESLLKPSLSYFNCTGKYPSGKPYRIPKFYHPVQMNRKLRDMEIWENAFIQLTTGRPLVASLDKIPPKPVILDLACGYGAWSILAARYFKESRVIGFDMRDIQPNLKNLHCDDIAERLTWVHGDMLKGLPFKNDCFDVVKSQYIELCVPECKWLDLLKEIYRVLKPDGIVELSLQAPIFPCPRFPPRLRSNLKRSCEVSKPGISLELQDHDPRDHSFLRDAYNAMLDVRHLNNKVLHFIPDKFKSLFDNVMISPICHAMLPCSSLVRDYSHDVVGGMTQSTSLENKPLDVVGLFLQTEDELTVEYGGCLPLNTTINLVLACKEAIWEQFEAMYSHFKRNDFEYLINNWEYDMRDRMDMASAIKEYLRWERNNHDAEPERQLWQAEFLKYHGADGIWDALPIPQSCRSIRIIQASKHSTVSEFAS